MRHLSWYILLILLFFAGDRLAGHLLQQQVRQSQFRYSRLYENKAAADILLLGNSRGLVFYQPYIDSITQKTSFNLSYNGLPMDAAQALTLDYLERYPAPKLLLIDITICDRENDALLPGFLPYALKSTRLDTLIREKTPKIWWGAKVASLSRYNHELFQRALFYRNQPDTDWLLDRVISETQAQDVSRYSYDLDVQPDLIQALKKTVKRAREKGIRVVLLVNPYFPGFQVKNLDALKAAAEQATGLPVLDYTTALNRAEDFGDYMHPNKAGSCKYIDILVRDSVFD